MQHPLQMPYILKVNNEEYKKYSPRKCCSILKLKALESIPKNSSDVELKISKLRV